MSGPFVFVGVFLFHLHWLCDGRPSTPAPRHGATKGPGVQERGNAAPKLRVAVVQMVGLIYTQVPLRERLDSMDHRTCIFRSHVLKTRATSSKDMHNVALLPNPGAQTDRTYATVARRSTKPPYECEILGQLNCEVSQPKLTRNLNSKNRREKNAPLPPLFTPTPFGLVLEATAWMKCVERLCKGVHGTKCRQLVLGDNMALVLTQCRWMSRLFALIVILRRAAAYILVRDMVLVSRWIMSEMNTTDAPSRPQEQHQPQDQFRHVTDEQAQSGACLARACEKMLQMKRTRVFVPCQKETLCRRRCCTLRVDTGTMGTLEANRPSQDRAFIALGRLERNHARLCFWEQDMRQMQT